jgi:hypothetical protein
MLARNQIRFLCSLSLLSVHNPSSWQLVHHIKFKGGPSHAGLSIPGLPHPGLRAFTRINRCPDRSKHGRAPKQVSAKMKNSLFGSFMVRLCPPCTGIEPRQSLSPYSPTPAQAITPRNRYFNPDTSIWDGVRSKRARCQGSCLDCNICLMLCLYGWL